MKRIFAIIELADSSTFDPVSDDDLDELAEDLLSIAPSVVGTATYSSLADLQADEKASK